MKSGVVVVDILHANEMYIYFSVAEFVGLQYSDEIRFAAFNKTRTVS